MSFKKMLSVETTQISLDMQENDSQRLFSFLKCRECGDLASDAVETLCCHALVCSECLKRRTSQCPECQAACSHMTCHLARRLIGTLPWSCPGCGKESTRSEQADHSLVCPQTERRCPAEGCGFQGLPDAFLIHLTDAHKTQLLSRIASLFGGTRRGRDRAVLHSSSESSDSQPESPGRRPQFFSSFFTPFEGRVDRIMGDPSQMDMPDTNKNYCGRPLNGDPCDCCDGNCGPNNGCNCVDCMRQDLITFEVTTPRSLVNREGAVATISLETGRFYCGRHVMIHDPRTDGYCGPDNGNNCRACSRLDEQLLSRYADIAMEWESSDADDHDVLHRRELQAAWVDGYDTVDGMD